MATINYQKGNIIYDKIFKIQNEVHLDYKAFSTISLMTFYSQILHIYMHKGEHIYIGWGWIGFEVFLNRI